MKASIIIPVKSSVQSCKRLLESLCSEADFINEVIIVENGSSEFQSVFEYVFPVKIYWLPVSNRSVARNFGVSVSSSDFLIFLDADVIIPRGWIAAVLKSFYKETVAVQTQIVPEGNLGSLLSHRRERGLRRGRGLHLSLNRSVLQESLINSAAFAIRKKDFLFVGGFDRQLERFEDWDFSLRLFSIPGEIRALKDLSCSVFFEGAWPEYALREFSQGFHIVRFHEKWNPASLSIAFLSLGRNIYNWILNFPSRIGDSRERPFLLLQFFYFLGNIFGLIRMAVSPYKGDREKFQSRIKVVIE